MEALVSIITPTYNSEAYILETIRSVKQQTHTKWEHIIIDDGSKDGTRDILRDQQNKDPRIKLIFLEQNSGSAVARNRGIKVAQGRFLTFLDSDDLWFPNFINRSITEIKKSGIPFVFSSYKRSNEDLKFVYSDFIVPNTVTYKDILKTNSISCLTAFLDITQLGVKYMPNVRKRQDMGLWLKYLKEIPYAKGIKEPLAIYRIRQNSLSRQKSKLLKSQWYFYRQVEQLNFIQSLYFMMCWMYLGYKKYKN